MSTSSKPLSTSVIDTTSQPSTGRSAAEVQADTRPPCSRSATFSRAFMAGNEDHQLVATFSTAIAGDINVPHSTVALTLCSLPRRTPSTAHAESRQELRDNLLTLDSTSTTVRAVKEDLSQVVEKFTDSISRLGDAEDILSTLEERLNAEKPNLAVIQDDIKFLIDRVADNIADLNERRQDSAISIESVKNREAISVATERIGSFVVGGSASLAGGIAVASLWVPEGLVKNTLQSVSTALGAIAASLTAYVASPTLQDRILTAGEAINDMKEWQASLGTIQSVMHGLVTCLSTIQADMIKDQAAIDKHLANNIGLTKITINDIDGLKSTQINISKLLEEVYRMDAVFQEHSSFKRRTISA